MKFDTVAAFIFPKWINYLDFEFGTHKCKKKVIYASGVCYKCLKIYEQSMADTLTHSHV